MSGATGLISVIVTTYDWPEALRAVLHGLRYQRDENFEVIVADDGSDERTRWVVQDANVRHVWRPHDGFRLADMRNRALAAAQGDYVIFLDGDCIPRPSFVSAHRRIAEPGWFVMGNRVMLKERMTKQVFSENLSPEDWMLPAWLWLKLTGKVNRIAPMITLPLGALRRRVRQTWKRAMGCNFAVWREDLDKVDGFDAAYVGWGWEDNDLFARLLRAGVRRKTGRFATGVIHLWHEPVYAKENKRRFDETIASDRMRARQGLEWMRDMHPTLDESRLDSAA